MGTTPGDVNVVPRGTRRGPSSSVQYVGYAEIVFIARGDLLDIPLQDSTRRSAMSPVDAPQVAPKVRKAALGEDRLRPNRTSCPPPAAEDHRLSCLTQRRGPT
jgi:hypothetical protein